MKVSYFKTFNKVLKLRKWMTNHKGYCSKCSWSMFLEGMRKTTRSTLSEQPNSNDSPGAYTIQNIASSIGSTLKNRLRDLHNEKQECLPLHHNT